MVANQNVAEFRLEVLNPSDQSDRLHSPRDSKQACSQSAPLIQVLPLRRVGLVWDNKK